MKVINKPVKRAENEETADGLRNLPPPKIDKNSVAMN